VFSFDKRPASDPVIAQNSPSSSLALLANSTKLALFPEVEKATTIDPGLKKASNSLANACSNPKSFPIADIDELFVPNAIEARGFLGRLNFPENSAAMCCASAKDPPFPAKKIVPPEFNASEQSFDSSSSPLAQLSLWDKSV